jgi:hypothetical protein
MRKNQIGQNRTYHIVVRDMHTGTLHIPTVTPKNEVPADGARFCVHWKRVEFRSLNDSERNQVRNICRRNLEGQVHLW